MSSTSFAVACADADGAAEAQRPARRGHSSHRAQFYGDTAFLFGRVADFLEAGERKGDRLVVIATAEHWRGICGHLRAKGVDPERLLAARRLSLLDADRCLAELMTEEGPDPVSFHRLVGDAVGSFAATELGTGPTAITGYGEMVDLLCQEGNTEAAIRLEQLWEEIAAKVPMSLLCSYRMDGFVDAVDGVALQAICDAHGGVSPAESCLAHQDGETHAREIVLLQQRARALETEVANRRQLEAALREALAEKERIEEALRQSEAELRGQNDDLARAIRFSEMFVGILGHDLRNPLSGVTTAARLLARRADSDKVAKPALRILSSAERMARMIDQLLDFTRIRLGQGIPLERTRVDLEELCRLAVDELADDGPVGDRVRLELIGDPNGIWDGDRLAQLVSNLVGNALAHGTAGVPARIRIDGRGPLVILAVENAGVVRPEILPRLFQPLRSGIDKKEARSSGLGLGLYISEQIAIAHGGSIEVASSEGEGTRITVRLPRMPAAIERTASA